MGFTGRESGGNSFLQCNGTQSLFHRLYSYSPTTRTLYQVMSDSEAKPPTLSLPDEASFDLNE